MVSVRDQLEGKGKAKNEKERKKERKVGESTEEANIICNLLLYD